MVIQGYIRLMICIGNTAFSQHIHLHQHIGMHLISKVPPNKCLTCVCECMCVSVCFPLYCMCNTSPKKTSKQEKRKNMQQKYLRLEACSLKIHHVFLWADLGLRKKGGKKRKEKIQKRLLAKTEKKEYQKKKRSKSKKDKSARVHVCLLFCFFFFLKKSTKTKTKGITDTDLSQEKTQDQRKLVLGVISFSPPAEENGCHCLWSLSLSFSPLNLDCSPESNFLWQLGGVVGGGL